MERLNYNQLYYFYVIATEGSIKAACKKLHLTQPTISGQLKELEESLGKPLFERKHRKLELNETGRSVLKRAERIFQIGQEISLSVSQESTKVRTTVRIGVSPALPVSLTHDFTLKIWKDDTNNIDIQVGENGYLVDLLNKGELDLILTEFPQSKTSKRYRTINLGLEDLVAVAAPKHKDLKKGFPKSLNGKTYISYSRQSALQNDIDYAFQLEGVKPDIIGSVDDTTLLRLLVERGLAFGILPESAVKERIKEKKLVKLGTFPDLTTQAWLTTTRLKSKRLDIRKTINSYLVKKKD